MAQQIKGLAVKPDDQSSIPKTHVKVEQKNQLQMLSSDHKTGHHTCMPMPTPTQPNINNVLNMRKTGMLDRSKIACSRSQWQTGHFVYKV